MDILIIGGAASGKSAFAEDTAKALSRVLNAPLAYVAALDPASGGDTTSRIERHSKARAGKGFVTLEWTGRGEPPDFSAHFDARPVALVEDFGNLVTNHLYPPERWGEGAIFSDPAAAAEAVFAKLSVLKTGAESFVCVTNEITLGGELPESMHLYAGALAALNARAAREATEVYAVIAGIPIRLK